jgi:SpoVK/Ycf46/Vps4 family AAA+-type ATPase
LNLIETYPDDKETEYNINMNALHKIKKPLTELNNMIGMKDLKENIIDQILFYIQNLHTLKTEIKGNDFMHTVIYGPPGTGKTEIAKIIGAIFSKMGVLTKGTFKKVTRSDLIAGYLGQTSLKTRDVINECLGGVLFIDEAYSLGNEEKKDSFSKECIDTLCEALSDHKDNLMVIVAGYEKDLNNCFFNYNQGLTSRFTWRFKTDEYTAEDLYKIFLKKVCDGGWSFADKSNIDVKWFEKNKQHFKFYGRDIETLFAKTKIAHSRRVFCLEPSIKKLLTIKDIDKGLEIYLKNEDSKHKEKDTFNTMISSMYI